MMDLLKSVKFGNVLKLPNKSGEMKTVHSGLKFLVHYVHGDGNFRPEWTVFISPDLFGSFSTFPNFTSINRSVLIDSITFG
jgi:hypothetical protein